ncbi:MAG: hypothetical protein JXB04_05205, partial [Kiritimatiellae bacterium]|nr:hypothetical protein [Kiritimatiellia bacterium]
GYTLTTPETHWADLDQARTNPVAVVYTNADFGFAPALTMDKALIGSSNVYEGQTVTFQITVTNDIQGTGGPDGGARLYDVWANAQDVSNDKASGSGTGNKAWNNITNAWIPPYPDGVSCVGPFDNAGEMLALMDFRLGYQVGSVTSVYVVLPVLQIVGTFGSDTFEVHLWKNGVELWSTSILASTISVGDLMFDVTAATGWTWQDFNSTNVTIKCITQKAGNPNVELHIDCFGFRVWGDGEWEDPLASTILNPVPLTDLYPTNVLKYLSADPLPTVVDEGTSPFGTLYWDNVGPIYPGGASTVMVYFTALEPPGNIALTETNYAIVTNATFMNGIPANSATDEVPVLIRPAGSIGDYVWRDYNRNGIQDDGTSNEVGIGNVRVILYPPTTNIDVGAGAGVPKTNLTDQYGWYLFDGLYSGGSYTVRVDTASLPGSWTNTCDEDSGTNAPNNQTVVTNMYPTSTVWSVQNHVTADFGYILPSLIDGHVWHDRNWSATDSPDDGEEWITNVVVWLYTNLSSAAIATNYTDVNGYFLFTGNYSGTYYVVVSTNSGALTNGTWYQTFDSDGTGTAHQVTVTVPLGGQGHADYSYVQVGAYAIGDTVFYDWDGNGVQDTNTEEGIFDIPVNLYLDRDGDGVVDYGYDLLLASTNTTSTGYYIFTNVPPTNYLVIVDESVTQFPPDHVCTADPYGAMDGRSALAITTSNNYVQDFGYQPYGCGAIGDWVWYDADGDGEQDVYEDGIADITVSLYVDANRDGTYVLRSSAVTDSTGWYLFTNLADSLYRVVVDTGDSDLPTDALDHVATPTTVTNHDIEIVNSSTNLTADFGFVLPGVLGDTVYWDYNENGTQDWNEDGATNVTVQLYYDANNDGAYDGGDVLLQTTSTDSNGIYHFTGLWPSNYLVYVVPTGTLDGAYLSADPDNDGWPCSHPLVTNCDGAYGYDLDFGEIFLGADFGYVPPGVIGDLVWIDQNDNGLRDSGEQGIPWITVLLYSNGTVVATTETDPDGWYAFGNLLDGTYSVSVDVHDVDFPTNVFPGLYANYDYDGVYDSRTTNIIISVGVVTQISGISCTECNTNVDFGYRFPGTNILSGTVGLDGTPFDGRMGTNGYGYATNEAPFAGVTLYLKLWNDDGDGVVEAGEYIDLMTTQTDTNGDYSFTHLPEGDGDDRYIVSLAAPREHLIMTTTNGSTEPPVLWVTNNVNVYGETRSAYQVMDIQPVTTNIDFAFTLAMEYDFGDLPVSYSTRIQDMPAGPQSQVLLTTNLYLGAVVDTEFNGQPSADATGDGGDEEGVGLVPSVVWQDGADGGQVSVVVGGIGDGSAWLTGYIDFNQNGSFLDSGDMVVSEAISAIGTYTYSFNVPSGSIQAFTSTVLYARFRIFPDKPFIPELAYVTTADNGEIEDYRWVLGSVSDQVWEDANSNNVYDLGEVRLTNVTVYADLNTNGVHDAGEPYMVTDTPDGRYGIGGFPDGTYPIRVDTNTGALAGSDYYATYDLDGGYDSAALVTLSGGEVNTNVDFGYRSPGSTYVLLQRLDVTVDDGQVVVEWETAGEVGTAGFYLLRQDQEGGAFVPVNKELLTALLDAPQGGIYRVVDPSAKPGGTYAYQINEVEFGGRINTHGPFPVTLPEAVGSASGARRDKSTVKQFFERTARVSEFARARRAAVKPAKAPIARSLSAEPAVKLESGAVVQPLKIRVGAGGVYFVDMALLADYLGGVSPERIIASVTGGGIRMTRRGQECRYLATSAGVYFYAEAVDSLYTTNDVYWLHWTPGTLAGSLAGTGPSPLADTVFMDTLHAEQDVAESTALTTNPASDYWGWNYMSAASSKLQTRVFPLYPKSVAVSEAPATLVSHLLGATTTATQREHHVRIALNGTPIGEAWWEGMVPVSLTNSFSQALLADGSNSVAVTALLDPGIKYSIVVADSFDLSYQRRYQAVDDQLLVRGDANPVISVTGFSEPQVRVLNVGDPHKPVLLKGVTVDAFGGGYRASFRPSGPAVPYQLFTLGSAKAPVSVVMDEPSSLRSAVNGAEYIVITVPELAAEAQVLADYRAGKGLQTMTVLLDDIYDEFNHGIPEAPAIRSFLAYASANWAVPPRYVLLAGEGTYDYRNCRGAGDNRIPTMMASTPHGIAESDSWYGDVDDDGVPDIAVGRLPALDATELNALVSRIIAYEEGEGGAWKQTMVLAADNPDHGGNFEGSSEEVEGFVPRDYGVQKVYLSELAPAEAKALFIGAMNEGSAFVNFYGHGGMDVMTGEGLLKSADAGALTNAPRLPVVVSMSCLLGRYGVPNYDCLSEALMLSDGGAVAAWSPSGQSYNQAAAKLASGFYTAVFHEGIGILGDAILRAMQAYDDPKRMWMLMIYNLLGDPAM